MNPTQLTLNIDAIELYDRSQYIKEDLLTESMQISWAHFYADSENARTYNADTICNLATNTKIIRVPDFQGHFLNAQDILNILQNALYSDNTMAKVIVTSSYMPVEQYCQYLIDNLDSDTNTALNIATIFNHIHNN